MERTRSGVLLIGSSGWIINKAILISSISVIVVCFSTLASAQQQNNSNLFVEGTVVDSTGAPIPEAQVQVTNGNRIFASANTLDDGSFQLHTQNRVHLTLIVRASGFETHEQQLSSAPTNLRITLTPATVTAKVTVAATRVETRQDQTAPSVIVLDATDLSSTSALTIDDALRQVPGFSLFRRSGSRTANPTSQGVSLRGIGASGASRAVVQADGVSLNDPFGGWVYWNRIPRESISNVEVLLGGASHLYGSSAMAGLVDISTKREQNVLSMSGSYGNENTSNASLFMAAGDHYWSASLAAEIFRTDGYVLVPEEQRGLIDTPAGSRNSVVNLRIERKVRSIGRVFGSASFFGESRKNGTPLQTNRTHLRQFVFGGAIDSSGAGTFVGRVYGGTQLFDQSFTAVSGDRNSELLTRVQRVPAQVLAFSGQWTRNAGNAQTLVAGAETREVRGASDELAFVNGRPTSFVDAGGRERSAGAYFEDLLRVGPHLFVNLGIRLDHWRNFAASSTTRSIIPGSATIANTFRDRTENAFSGHASGVYRFSERVSTVVAFSRAFRAPTLNELYRSFRVGSVLTLANENLRAERLTGGEAGLRLSSWRSRMATRVNFFWNEINRPVANITLQVTPTLITRQRQNLGRTRSRGLELYNEIRFDSHWNLSTGYLLADATVIRFPANTQLEGLRIPQVAKHQFTFNLRYLNPSVITVGLQGRAASSQFDDDQNVFRLGSYFTTDAFVSRRVNENVELFCAFENLFNQRYEIGKTPITTLGPPILFRAGFRVHLGPR